MNRRSFLKVAAAACSLCVVEKKLVLPNEIETDGFDQWGEQGVFEVPTNIIETETYPRRWHLKHLVFIRELTEHIDKHGQLEPIYAVWGKDNRHLHLINGLMRVKAVKRLGHETIFCACWQTQSSPDALYLETENGVDYAVMQDHKTTKKVRYLRQLHSSAVLPPPMTTLQKRRIKELETSTGGNGP